MTFVNREKLTLLVLFLAFACKTETLSSLYYHALLILTKSSKSLNKSGA